MADEIKPIPRSPILGLFSDLVNLPLEYMSAPQRTQQMQGVAEFIRSTGVPSTLERLSYGQSLFSGAGGLGGTTRLRPEAAEAALTVAPMVGPAARLAGRAVMATKGLPVGMGIKDVSVELNEAGNFLSAKSPFGQVGGVIRPPDAISDKPYLRINFAEVEEAQRGKGIGKNLYEALINEANNRGLRIFSDYTVEKPAVNVYKSLGKSGYNIKDMSSGVLDDGTVYGVDANRPAFEIRPKSTSTISAPQNAALRLAQQRAALPVSEGGLGLPPNNTPMDRARAMGYTTEGYRGSTVAETTHQNPLWWSEDPQYASAYAAHTIRPPKGQPDPYAGNVMPVLVNIGKSKDFEKFNVGGVPTDPFSGFKDGVETGLRRYAKNEITGDMGGKIWEALTVPQNVRSRFAAFDPTRRNEPDLLAGALPFTALLDEENRQAIGEFLTNPIMYRDPFGSSVR